MRYLVIDRATHPTGLRTGNGDHITAYVIAAPPEPCLECGDDLEPGELAYCRFCCDTLPDLFDQTPDPE